jgi:beta-mannosidase
VESWSSLDYGGGWKLLNHMAQRFFRPVNVVAIPDTLGTVRLVAINDTAAALQVDLEAFAVTLDGAGTRPLASAGAPVGTDAAETLSEFRADAIEDGEILAFRWTASNGIAGGDVFTPVRWKHLALRDPKIGVTTTTDGGTLTARLTAEAVALFATLEADRPGRFSTNAIALFPGHPAEITFTPADGDSAGIQLTVRDLYSSFATT